MEARRPFSALERLIGGSSGPNRVWHGYAPCKPAMPESRLTVFRAAHHFV